MDPMLPCDGPHCSETWPITADYWVQVDAPGLPFQVFCSLRCLAIWGYAHAQTGFRDVRQVGREV
jgi:hypothetical protein